MSAVKHTPGPWRAIAQGGSSTVVAPAMPSRNDRRSEVTYGYRDGGEYCVGYPFLYQSDPGEREERTRMDFVCFSHADARLIAAAPDMKEEGEALVRQLEAVIHLLNGQAYSSTLSQMNALKAAIARAEGREASDV